MQVESAFGSQLIKIKFEYILFINFRIASNPNRITPNLWKLMGRSGYLRALVLCLLIWFPFNLSLRTGNGTAFRHRDSFPLRLAASFPGGLNCPDILHISAVCSVKMEGKQEPVKDAEL